MSITRYQFIGRKINNLSKEAGAALDRIQDFSVKGVFVYWHPGLDKYAAFSVAGDSYSKLNKARKELCKCGVLHRSILGDQSCNEVHGWIPLIWPEGYSPMRKCARLTETPAQLSYAGALAGATLGGLWSLWQDRELKLPWAIKLRNTIIPATVGAGIGTLPGIGEGLMYRSLTRKKNSDGTYSDPDVGFLEAMFSSEKELRKKSPTYNANAVIRSAKDDLNKTGSLKKVAFGESSLGGLDTGNSSLIHVDNFNRVVWDDANNGFTKPENALLVSSALNASRPTGSTFVTPGAVVGTLVNAGIGWATAGVIGKTLGALGGLSEASQSKLREIGTWGGVINGVGQSMLR